MPCKLLTVPYPFANGAPAWFYLMLQHSIIGASGNKLYNPLWHWLPFLLKLSVDVIFLPQGDMARGAC